jgi:small subunit ribosomal protein S6
MNVTTEAASAQPMRRGAQAREYETIYILRSDVDSETAERIQSRIAETLEQGHAKLVRVEVWGRRKLAYPIRKHRRGVYVYLKYVGSGGLVAEVERKLKLQDAVVKFMTVQTGAIENVAALQIDPEETKFGKLDFPPEDEKEESREKQLGLVDFAPEVAKPRAEEGEFFDADESEEAPGKDEPEEDS